MSERATYPSDLSDARWALIEDRLTAWRQARTEAGVGGRVAEHDLREIFNAILYVNRTGIAWRYLPHDLPPWQSVYGYFKLWSEDGIFTDLNYSLNGLVRNKTGRRLEPKASIMDSQSVKTSTNVPLDTQGIDAGKKNIGRKRGIITDTIGLLLAVIVTAASASDNLIGIDLLNQATAIHPTLTKAWVDTGFRQKVVEHGAALGVDVEIVSKDPQVKGFTIIKRRWVVERTLGWLMHHRRLVRDYETLPTTSENMIRIAMIDNLTRRAADETTPTWRDPQIT
ncbi:IS5 family transposase [Winogradskya humida]|uniref:DDE transposase n=1 Tax=Winogradskya humida TaxID=113566 RepID=A0ABQ3ZJZ4_9ACTN|nr:IS5 family transposase [Actinoplanes humidus]GIE18916.1 DDE transposase [Actinoplanes humidus]